MTWFTDPDNQAESAKSRNLLAIAIDADFPDGHVRLSSWIAPLQINGQQFLGVGKLLSLPQVSETTQLIADTRVYQLSGVDPATVPESEIDNCFGRSFTEYLVWLDPDTRQIIGWEINFEGLMDRVNRRDGASPIIELSVEHRFVILEETDGWYFTDEHQQQFFPGDHGLDQVRYNGAITITWGGGYVNPGGGAGPRVPQSPNKK